MNKKPLEIKQISVCICLHPDCHRKFIKVTDSSGTVLMINHFQEKHKGANAIYGNRKIIEYKSQAMTDFYYNEWLNRFDLPKNKRVAAEKELYFMWLNCMGLKGNKIFGEQKLQRQIKH